MSDWTAITEAAMSQALDYMQADSVTYDGVTVFSVAKSSGFLGSSGYSNLCLSVRGASGGALDVDMNAGSGSTREAVENVVFMVKELRKGTQIDRIQDANNRLQFAEGEADKVMLGLLKELYHGPYDAKETMILQELFEMAEKAVDRCRDAGNVVFQIVLKYS